MGLVKVRYLTDDLLYLQYLKTYRYLSFFIEIQLNTPSTCAPKKSTENEIAPIQAHIMNVSL